MKIEMKKKKKTFPPLLSFEHNFILFFLLLWPYFHNELEFEISC